jgi:hypothetical protein
MKASKLILNFAQLIFFAVICIAPASANPTNTCWQASNKQSLNRTTTLIDDEDKKYISYETLVFGTKGSNSDGYVGINGIELNIDEIKFTLKNSGKAVNNIRKDDLNMLLGEVVKAKHKSKTYYCLLLPFSGLGASGSFSKYSVVLTIPKTTKRPEEISGTIGIINNK